MVLRVKGVMIVVSALLPKTVSLVTRGLPDLLVFLDWEATLAPQGYPAQRDVQVFLAYLENPATRDLQVVMGPQGFKE